MVRSWRRHVTRIHPASSQWFRLLLVVQWCGLEVVLAHFGPFSTNLALFECGASSDGHTSSISHASGDQNKAVLKERGDIQPFSSKLDLIIMYPSVSFTWLSLFFCATLLLQMWSECARERMKPPTSPQSPTERFPRGPSTWWTCLGSWWRSHCGERRWGHLSCCTV